VTELLTRCPRKVCPDQLIRWRSSSTDVVKHIEQAPAARTHDVLPVGVVAGHVPGEECSLAVDAVECGDEFLVIAPDRIGLKVALK
jgi:hypothetical protein